MLRLFTLTFQHDIHEMLQKFNIIIWTEYNFRMPLLLILFEKIHQCPMGNLFVNTVMNFREHITLVAMLKTRGFWPIALFHFLHLPYLSFHSMAIATLNKVV